MTLIPGMYLPVRWTPGYRFAQYPFNYHIPAGYRSAITTWLFNRERLAIILEDGDAVSSPAYRIPA